MKKTVFKNVFLYDGDLNARLCRRVIVEDGYIRYIGNDEIGADENCEIYEGGYLLKSFCDHHFHLPGSALYDLYGINLCMCGSAMEYKKVLTAKSKDKKVTCGNIVRGFGWNIDCLSRYFAESEQTPLEFLDDIFPDIPAVMFSLDFHSCWCNTLAVKMLKSDGIVSVYRDREVPHGAECIFHEEVANKIFALPRYGFSEEEIRTAFLILQKQLIGYGITEVFTLFFIGATFGSMLNVLRGLDRTGALKIKIWYSCTVLPSYTEYEIKKTIENSLTYSGGNLNLISVKAYADGVIDNHSAYLSEPYSDVDSRGMSLWTERKFIDTVKCASSYGLPMHIHAIGDAAAEFSVKCLAAAGAPANGRHIVTHLQLCKEETMSLMAKRDIVACMQPFWFLRGKQACITDAERLGKRADGQYPVRSMADRGVKILFSSDCPATVCFDPILGINMASEEDGSGENVTRKQAYMAYYAGSFRDDPIILGKGDPATFIRTDKNLLEFQDAKITDTFINGIKE